MRDNDDLSRHPLRPHHRDRLQVRHHLLRRQVLLRREREQPFGRDERVVAEADQEERQGPKGMVEERLVSSIVSSTLDTVFGYYGYRLLTNIEYCDCFGQESLVQNDMLSL